MGAPWSPRVPDPNPAASEPAAPPKRSRVLAAVGLLMLSGAAGLTWAFARSPMGTLSFAPTVWKGDVYLLAAGFLGCYGALLLALRRFSLAAVLASMVLAGALTSWCHNYAYGIFDLDRNSFVVKIPVERREEVLKELSRQLTSERLTDFARDLAEAGYAPNGVEFTQVDIRFGSEGIDDVEVYVEFTYLPYVHPRRRAESRAFAMRYAEGVACFAAGPGNDAPVRIERLRGGGIEAHLQMDHALLVLTEALWVSDFFVRFPGVGRLPPMRSLEDMRPTFDWLSEREADPALANRIKAIRDTLKEGFSEW
ncbi:MAG: hypothetical protein M5U26_00640 [Planctomycetota bacterium]|nr:hypothetical protein [Planctomycetota bacterium]